MRFTLRDTCLNVVNDFCAGADILWEFVFLGVVAYKPGLSFPSAENVIKPPPL